MIGKDIPKVFSILLVVGAIAIVGAGFAAIFAVWHTMDRSQALALGVPVTAFNLKTAHALDRGCNACHADHLAADVNKLLVGRDKPELHGIFSTSYNIPMRAEDCLICHNTRTSLAFAGSIHSLHLHSAGFVNMGGNCDSCHGTLLNGKFVLYDDESRYQILNGVSYSLTPTFTPPAADLIRNLRQAAAAN